MKNYLVLLLFSTIGLQLKAQIPARLGHNEKNKNLTSKEFLLLEKFAFSKGYGNRFYDKENSGKFSGTDSLGKVDLSLEIYTYSAINDDQADLNILTNKVTKVVKYWLELEDGKVYIVENGKVVERKDQQPIINGRSVSDCLSIYLRPGYNSCTSCANCIKDCKSKHKKRGKRIACALWNCTTNCTACVVNVTGFVACVIDSNN